MGKLSGVVLRVRVQFDAGPTCPSLDERVGHLSRSEDGIDTFERNRCAQGFDHLVHLRKNVFGSELIDGQWRTDEDGICALRAWGDGENEIQGRVCGRVVGRRAGQPERIGGNVSVGFGLEETLRDGVHDVRVVLMAHKKIPDERRQSRGSGIGLENVLGGRDRHCGRRRGIMGWAAERRVYISCFFIWKMQLSQKRDRI